MNLQALFENKVLLAALLAWGLAQALKVPIEYLRTRKWNWALLLRTGGLPSSHTSLVTATAHSIGLYQGFGTSIFALAAILAMIVIYDATGIRRQAGKHAELINKIIRDLASGHPLKEEEGQQLREVLGHTWVEALSGLVWGLAISTLVWWFGQPVYLH